MASWTDKPTALRDIAARLNIGLDALVFADDNPFERNIVRRELPMVAVPEMPADPALYAGIIAAGGYFEALHLTEVVLAYDQKNKAALNARIKALELLRKQCENYVEEGWLEYGIRKAKEKLASGN